MFFDDAETFVNAPRKAVTAFGMSGVGKTYLGTMLRRHDWFHYSVDYRIGTRYMGEHIVDNFKMHAMKVPFLRELLLSDSIYISSNITFENLQPLSTYLGAPGNPEMGGLPFAEYQRRQEQHRVAEVSSLVDVPHFMDRAEALYGYGDFLADTGGSLIEVVDIDDPADPVIDALTSNTLLLYIRGTEDDAQALIERYTRAPKPMYYRPDLLVEKWEEYKTVRNIRRDDNVEPRDFATWGFEAILRDRLPRYQMLADRYGYTVESTDISSVRDDKDFLGLMRKAIADRAAA